MGREAEVSRPDTLPEARRRIRFPALRFSLALLFVMLGAAVARVGLALLRPWLRRFSASQQPEEGCAKPAGEEREPSAHDTLRAQIEERIVLLQIDPWDDPRGFDRVWKPGKWGES